MTLGEDSEAFTPEKARKRAGEILAQVRFGKNPAEDRSARRKESTLSELADRYLAEHVKVHNKPSTQRAVESVVNFHFKGKSLGKLKLRDVTRAKVKEWHHAMRDTPGAPNRALADLSKMLSLAAKEWELIPVNPCLGMKRFAEQARERHYSPDELKRIGEALTAAERDTTELPGCIAALRLLALTGMRVGEVLGLRWEYVDLQRSEVRLPDSKTGARTVALGAPAVAYLASLSEERDSDFVVHGPDAKEPLSKNTMRHAWDRIAAAAKIANGRRHDFRRTGLGAVPGARHRRRRRRGGDLLCRRDGAAGPPPGLRTGVAAAGRRRWRPPALLPSTLRLGLLARLSCMCSD